jgi:hypothetical protein
MNKNKILIEDAIYHLQNLGLQFNEHRVGNDYIHISAYESLLDWSIEAMTFIKDKVFVD